MNIITHFLIGWVVASVPRQSSRRDRALIAFSSVAPDLDGFGLLPELLTRDSSDPLFWWTDYHHRLGHNLPFAVVVTAVAISLANRKALVGLLSFIAFHLHLAGDLIGSRGPDGYQWPIPYLAPFRDQPELSWSGQWALNAWPNILLTVLLLALTFVLGWRRGYSALECFSTRADQVFVAAIRRRFPATQT